MDFTKNQGAMWNKVSKNNKDYLSGQITIDGKKIGFMAFANKKAVDNQPDYQIYLNTDNVQTPTVVKTAMGTAVVGVPDANTAVATAFRQEEIKIENIPF